MSLPSSNSPLSTVGSSGLIPPWLPAKATHYGPFPARPWLSESGYQDSEAGVGCSNGQPGGDPRWRAILASNGTHNRSEVVQMGLLSGSGPTVTGLSPPSTESEMDSVIRDKGLDRLVWPRAYTVAVSERAFGGRNKDKICFQTVQIRNAKNRSRTITAHVVDFCPANGCLWDNQFNVDVYGQAAWMALGGDLDAGNLEIEVDWPKDIIPNGSASVKLSFGLTVLMWNVLLLSL